MKQLLRDVVATWVEPREALRDLWARAPGEDRLLAYLMFACMIALVLGVPRLLESGAGAETIGPAIVGALIFAPLFFFGLAALSHIVMRLLGGQGGWQQARLALFWALLAIQPLAMIAAIVAIFGLTSLPLNILTAIGFFYLWLGGLVGLSRP